MTTQTAAAAPAGTAVLGGAGAAAPTPTQTETDTAAAAAAGGGSAAHARRYTLEFMLSLRNSPLVQRPPDMPTMDELGFSRRQPARRKQDEGPAAGSKSEPEWMTFTADKPLGDEPAADGTDQMDEIQKFKAMMRKQEQARGQNGRPAPTAAPAKPHTPPSDVLGADLADSATPESAVPDASSQPQGVSYGLAPDAARMLYADDAAISRAGSLTKRRSRFERLFEDEQSGAASAPPSSAASATSPPGLSAGGRAPAAVPPLNGNGVDALLSLMAAQPSQPRMPQQPPGAMSEQDVLKLMMAQKGSRAADARPLDAAASAGRPQLEVPPTSASPAWMALLSTVAPVSQGAPMPQPPPPPPGVAISETEALERMGVRVPASAWRKSTAEEDRRGMDRIMAALAGAQISAQHPTPPLQPQPSAELHAEIASHSVPDQPAAQRPAGPTSRKSEERLKMQSDRILTQMQTPPPLQAQQLQQSEQSRLAQQPQQQQRPQTLPPTLPQAHPIQQLPSASRQPSSQALGARHQQQQPSPQTAQPTQAAMQFSAQQHLPNNSSAGAFVVHQMPPPPQMQEPPFGLAGVMRGQPDMNPGQTPHNAPGMRDMTLPPMAPLSVPLMPDMPALARDMHALHDGRHPQLVPQQPQQLRRQPLPQDVQQPVFPGFGVQMPMPGQPPLFMPGMMPMAGPPMPPMLGHPGMPPMPHPMDKPMMGPLFGPHSIGVFGFDPSAHLSMPPGMFAPPPPPHILAAQLGVEQHGLHPMHHGLPPHPQPLQHPIPPLERR